jgi:hypothetical protein
MNVIEEEVKQLVDKELQSAQKRFGLHHSWHEKYGVTLEELQECEEEIDFMRKFLDQAFGDIRSEQPEKTDKFFKLTEKHAIRCAIEAIQCAAMCRKGIAEQAQDAKWQVSSDGYYPYCPICGAQPDKKTRFCAECGAKLGE